MTMRYIKLGVILVLSILAISTYTLYTYSQTLKEELAMSISNEKAFLAENSLLKDENRVFKFTIEQLNYYNDSILDRMNTVRKELEIKDKDLKQMQYLLSKATKKDTLVFRDTLFVEPSLDMDTLIGDKWFQMELGLKYPSTIAVTPTFVSEKYVVVSTRKETINPPKKCWLSRLFQKKHRVAEVDVVEKSPYIKNTQQRFIEIIE